MTFVFAAVTVENVVRQWEIMRTLTRQTFSPALPHYTEINVISSDSYNSFTNKILNSHKI